MITTPADPVRVLMDRHRELCEQAVHPLEIAAVLEARGLTDRGAARYRHRDVFSLAEELYARVPRADAEAVAGAVPPPVTTPRGIPARARPAALWRAAGPLLPLAVTLAAVLAAVRPPEPVRPPIPLLLPLAGGLALLAGWAVLRRDLPGRAGRAGLVAACAAAAPLAPDVLPGLFPGLLPAQAPDPARAAVGAAVIAWGLAVSVWTLRAFAAGARRAVVGSRTLEDFRSATRPRLAAALALPALALGAPLLAAALRPGTAPPPSALLPAAATAFALHLALLVAAHGRPRRAVGALLALPAVAAAWWAALPAVRPTGPLAPYLPGVPLPGAAPVPDSPAGALIGVVTGAAVAVALLLPAVPAACCRAAVHRIPAFPARRDPEQPSAAPAAPVTRPPGRAAGSSPPPAEPPAPPTRREQP
ncbi:hypothetical protein GCM10027160_53150 [Streptomyces calidiresistens]|uniref:Integral membrane protein n=1 Tax=Streptomyces calidiresistens TaxID=1485586 RepID=A0A7W3XWD7_9ACTN|nr:hypothetical protein [Streptomyces calidiresistens]MBB0229656.1 hypothetical protein [Streptomyces calidiresistens]